MNQPTDTTVVELKPSKLEKVKKPFRNRRVQLGAAALIGLGIGVFASNRVKVDKTSSDEGTELDITVEA